LAPQSVSRWLNNTLGFDIFWPAFHTPIGLGVLALVLVALLGGRRSGRSWCAIGAGAFAATAIALYLWFGPHTRFAEFPAVAWSFASIAGCVAGGLVVQLYRKANRLAVASGVLIGGLLGSALFASVGY
jgi:peptidoglycan/LPS O-acetylase OafA/YrhL